MTIPTKTAFYSNEFNIIKGLNGQTQIRIAPADPVAAYEMGITEDEMTFDVSSLAQARARTLNELETELPADFNVEAHPDIRILDQAAVALTLDTLG